MTGRMRGILTLGLALVLGLSAAGLAVYALQMARPTEAATIETVSVVVPRQEISARTAITASMLQLKTVPAEGVHPQTALALADVTGKVARQTLIAGEPILLPKLSDRLEESGLALVVPNGQRAVAVRVDEVIGVGGLVLPGDRVDVLAVCKSETNVKAVDAEAVEAGNSSVETTSSGIAWKAATPLQNLVALAVAQEVQETAQPDTGSTDGNADEEDLATTVTVAVDPEQAQQLAAYSEGCVLRLALRPADDTTIVELTPTELDWDTVGQ